MNKLVTWGQRKESNGNNKDKEEIKGAETW